MSPPLVWLVTGCSTGLGLALARTVLAHGHTLIASSRNPSKHPDLVREVEQAGGHWIALDVTAPNQELEITLHDAVQLHGRIDVIINNAGYSTMGAFEDITLNAAHNLMETNFFGPYKIIQCLLPTMRERKSGTIVNISSTAGIRVLPSFSVYASSKFALEALSEGLSKEVEAHNVRVLLVEPGALRTNFLESSSASYLPVSEPYKRTCVEDMMASFEVMNGKQAGDPGKAAERIFEVVIDEGLAKGKQTLRLPIGSDAVKAIRGKLARVAHDVDEMEEAACSVDIAS